MTLEDKCANGEGAIASSQNRSTQIAYNVKLLAPGRALSDGWDISISFLAQSSEAARKHAKAKYPHYLIVSVTEEAVFYRR